MLQNITLSQYMNNIDDHYSEWQAYDMTKHDWI